MSSNLTRNDGSPECHFDCKCRGGREDRFSDSHVRQTASSRSAFAATLLPADPGTIVADYSENR